MNQLKHPILDVIQSIDSKSCPKDINFHCHSTFSDGSLEPIDIFTQACDLKLKHLAITDHHSVRAFGLVNELIQKNYNSSPYTQIWSGIEISCLLKGCLVHIIGLGFDVNSESLTPYIQGCSPSGIDLQADRVISSIRKANGISILAHPARYRLNYKILIDEAYSIGVNGIEVWYDYEFSQQWRPSELICESIHNISLSYNLLESCGTDSHGYSLLSR